MRLTTLLSCALLSATANLASAQADFKLTELFAGLSGNDGTRDWIEVTNFGTAVGDTATLFYDDESADISSGGQLDSFVLAPGESAVFLLDPDPANDFPFATSIEQFTAIWGGGINVGLTNGGGGLGQGGDAANLLAADGSIIDTLTYVASGDTATFEDPTGNGPDDVLSTLGLNGAYESAAFENADLALPPDTTVTLVGSPGVVPEPTTTALVLLALTGLASHRSRS